MSKKPRETPSHATQRVRRIRVITFSIVVFAVLGLAASLLIPAFSRPVLPAMSGTIIDIAADMGGYDKQEIRVKVGKPITIRLTSLDNSHHTDGGGKHQWAVDELNANVVAEPESVNSITFTPGKTGTFTYYCDICCGGRANPTMQGKIIVEA